MWEEDWAETAVPGQKRSKYFEGKAQRSRTDGRTDGRLYITFVEEWAGGVRGKGKGVEGKSGKRKKGTKMERVKVRNRKKEKKEKGEEK